jgi:hypothetical protein
MITKIIFFVVGVERRYTTNYQKFAQTLKSYKLNNSCIYIVHNNKYSRKIINSQSHLSNVVWNECYTYSWVIKHLMESLSQYSSCRTSSIYNPFFSLFTTISNQCVLPIIDGHISFFFFMDKKNAFKVFNFSPTLIW